MHRICSTATFSAICVSSVLSLSAVALGQACTPGWDGRLGSIGVADGYVAPMLGVNFAGRDRLFVGGSFTGIGGAAGSAVLSEFNPADGVWSRVGGGVSTGFTNGFATSLVLFDAGQGPEVVLGGFFASAGGVAGTQSLARWNGSRWANLGSALVSPSSIWAMTTFNDAGTTRLIAGGGFPGIGGGTSAGIGAWDGTTWTSLGSGIAGSFSPTVFSLATFDDGTGPAVYAGGRFDGVGGVAGTAQLARWDGRTWSRVGTGFVGTSPLFGIEGMAVFNDGRGPALYVAGAAIRPGGGTLGPCNVARWDGRTWECLGAQIGTGRLTSIAAFDDGSGSALYIGGTAMPQIDQFARWNGTAWQSVDGGFTGPAVPPSNFPSVFGLHVWQDRLYVGGNFSQAGTASVPARGIVIRTGCPKGCYPDCNSDGKLDVQDFACFQNRFALGEAYANCNEDTLPGGGPRFDVQDFTCFQNRFALGCP